jgi:spermidine synthase
VAATAFLELPNPFSAEPATLLLHEPADAPREELIARLRKKRYDKPFVVDDGRLRVLFFSLDFIQSAMRLSAPIDLELAYTRKMMAFLLFHSEVRSLLLIGLGGGSLVKFCHHHLPQIRITAVESDPHVLAFREPFCLPPDDERLAVVLDDGADFVARCTLRPDVLLVDAFDAQGFSPTITTREFYENAYARLADDGILVANLTGETDDRLAHTALIRDAFDDKLLVMTVEGGYNHLVFAFRNRKFSPRWPWIASRARELRSRYGLDFPAFAKTLERCRRHGPAPYAI